jgi:hypothetical protein
MVNLTTEYSKACAQTFIDILLQANNPVFVAYGGITNSSNNVPTVNTAPIFTEIDVLGHYVYGKLISSSDLQPVVNNNTWTSNTVYAQWDPTNSNIFQEPFYVLTSSQNVYKCIFNNYNAPSTVEPTVVINQGTFQTSDGYIWKFMYNISGINNALFLTQNYVPVVIDANVAAAAIPGTIDAYNVISSNSVTNFNSGSLQQISNSTTLVISNSAANTDNIFNNASIYVTSSEQVIPIQSYNSLTKTITLTEPLVIYSKIYVTNTNGFVFNSNTYVNQQTSNWFITGLYTTNNTPLYNGQQFIATPNSTTANVFQVISTGAVTNIIVSANKEFASNSYFIGVNDVNNPTIAGTCSVSGNAVIGTNTTFTTAVAPGNYIILSQNTGSGVAQVLSVTNNTYITLQNGVLPLNNDYTTVYSSAQIQVANTGGVISSTTLNQFQANIIDAQNLDLVITFDPVNQPIQVGESFFNSNTGFTGVVQYANNSTIISSVYSGNVANVNTITTETTNLNLTVVNIKEYTILTATVNNASELIIGAPIFYSNAYAGIVNYITISPNAGDFYFISPTVTITGDGQNAAAYSVVNSATQTITNVVSVNPGINYTTANVVVNGATVTPLLSPRKGHGSNAFNELGVQNILISKLFSNSTNENYSLPNYGEYNKVGLIYQTLWNEIVLEVSNYNTYEIEAANTIAGFVNNEIVISSDLNFYGNYVSSSNNTMIVANTYGTLASNTYIKGTVSKVVANVISSSVLTFNSAMIGNTVTQNNITGTITSANSSTIVLTSVEGNFLPNNFVTCEAASISANVTNVYKNFIGNYKPLTSFNQIIRYPLTNNNTPFILYETVTNNNDCFAKIISTNTDYNVSVSNNVGNFMQGEIFTSNVTSGVVYFANSSYMMLSYCNSVPVALSTITGQSSGATATINTVYDCLMLGNIQGDWKNNYTGDIYGTTSNSFNINTLSSTIIYPDFNYNTGKEIFADTFIQFPLTSLNQSLFQLILNFNPSV